MAVKKVNTARWKIPKLWPGGTCFILGGGPSLKDFDIEQLRGRRVIAVNCAFRLAPWIDVMYYGDCTWPKKYGGDDFYTFKGLKITTCPQHVNRHDVKVVTKKNAPYGIITDPSFVSWNLSSGACAVNLAFHFGVKKIVLLGYDMQYVNGEKNWHNFYKDQRGKHEPYARFLMPFNYIAKDLARHEIECVNATPGSKLTLFPMVGINEVLNDKLRVCA